MNAVVALYRWLVSEGLISPAAPLWQEKDRYLGFKNAKGVGSMIKVKVTDVSIKVPVQNDPYDGIIDDGGRLRPLTLGEQKWIIEALAELDNPEMTLIHALMLATGARIQTVLTLRVWHARLEAPEHMGELRLPVGPGTGIDTKHGKRATMHIPCWLQERLHIYSLSDRATTRRMRAPGGDRKDQYLFLTQQGNPYYQGKSEARRFDPSMNVRHQKRAQTVRAFITEHVIPYVRERYDPKFHYRIHDLRATYGMNLTDIQLGLVEQKKTTLARAREFVRTRMWHERGSTTDLYLNYRRNNDMVYEAVDAHEQYYRELIERAWKGGLHRA
ncbi:hypothetical protein WK55_22005 [Burkholderia ubonensis]|nr:hypothetical protein WK55_22005 [Burkholderia ubonensis]